LYYPPSRGSTHLISLEVVKTMTQTLDDLDEEIHKRNLGGDTARAVAKPLYSGCEVTSDTHGTKNVSVVGSRMINSGVDANTTRNIQGLGSFPMIELLRLCEDQKNLLRDDDRLIERIFKQLSEYEQELFDKDFYIKELEDELRQTQNASFYKEDSL
jgi:hypothetical protein